MEEKKKSLIWGGKRSNCGRKKGSKNKSSMLAGVAREKIIASILTRWEPIAETLMDVGLGKCYVEKFIGKKRKVYRIPPDPHALIDLIELVVGKPKQTVESNINMPQLEELSSNIRTILERK